MLVLGFLIVVTGVDPILVTELSVIFSVVALPLTYIPILLVANDRAYMGSYANGRVANIFGVFYLVVVLVIAVAAIPLLVLSNMGTGMTEIDLGLGRARPPAHGQRGPPLRQGRRPRARGRRDGEPRVVAILAGPAAWRGAGVSAGSRRRIARGELVRVPWDEVAEIESCVQLRKTAQELRLGRGDDRARALDREDPGVVAVRLSELLGLPVRTESGGSLGRVTTCAPSSRRAR